MPHSQKKLITLLIDNGVYDLCNLGDLAMLQVAVKRIVSHFQDARIYVFTNFPNDLGKYCPEAIPVSPESREIWHKARILPIPFRLFPKILKNGIYTFEKFIKFRFPKAATWLMRLRQILTHVESQAAKDYFSIIQAADMVITSGGGFITDSFEWHASYVLDTLLLAQRLGKPTAMFGQGIGPLKNASLLRKVSQVLPRLNVLGLREDLTSLEIIKSLNVSQEHVFITGDDAIEVAVQMINPDIEKKCIGVNIRQDYYAGNFKNLLPEIGTIIKSISESHHAPIIPLPIYLGEPNSDLSSITQMCDLDMIEYQLSEHIITPEDIIRQISRCKVVITGSYHAGVFALAQGIPVVALVGSDYYAAKFYGLAKQFEAGCQVEMLRSKNLIDRFRYSIEYSMQMQNEYEPKLINSAKQQVKQSRAAWEHFLVHMPS